MHTGVLATLSSAQPTEGHAMPAARQNPGEFVHLHLHTEYSLLDGGNQVEKLVARVAELGMKSVAVTDHGNLFGAASVYLACKDKGIKAILGTEAYVTPPGKPRTDRTYSGGGEGGFHLVLLAENNEGWNNLLVLASEAYLTGFYYKPRIDRELLEKHSAGLIAINGHLGSEIGDHLLSFQRTHDRKFWDLAVESAVWHDRVFNTAGRGAGQARFFIELQHHVPEQNAINPLLVKLAREHGVPLVCDNDAHFLRAEDHDAHDTLICISTGKGKNDDHRMRYPRELYVKSPAEMEEVFAEYGSEGREALDNSVAIAARCNVELPLGQNNAPAVQIDVPKASGLPRWDAPEFAGDLSAWYSAYCGRFELKPFPKPPSSEEMAASKAACDTALRMLSEAGFRWRYGFDAAEGRAQGAPKEKSELTARLDRELKILADKNISAYFLIVWDFVNWGRQRGIPSNARGSGVGTMVGYVLGLSNACPVRYGLLFERFTDPDRSEYPDIDIDLCQDGRGEVIDYVRRKYGHVAQIITFGTLKARAAIRDVGRVLEIPLPDVDRVAKLVPEQLNITIEEALKQEPELKKLYDTDARYRQLLDNAIQLEGHTRHAGVHAAGVIVATRPLHEIVPLYRPPGSEGTDIITQWDGPTCERMGLLKMDFLGLRTISVVERAKKLIRATLSEEEIWKAVGRGAEYREWTSGRVVERTSGGAADDQTGGEVVSGSAGLAERDGAHTRGVSSDGGDAEIGDLRTHKPDEAGGGLGAAQHRGGVRKAHSPRVSEGSPDRGGKSVGVDDRVRVGGVVGHDRGLGGDDAAVQGTRPHASRTHSESGAEELGVASPSSTTRPPDHPTTRFLRHPLDLDRLSFDDQRVFELFRRGETTGVFQFESGGMRRLLVEMKPDRLEDLIAANALFRPGPMDLIPDYNRRKHGTEEVPRVHEIVDRYTSETYGVMVYQEQVMQIVHGLGGIKLRDAYTLIKNISKKKHDKIEKERPKFVEGSQRQGLSKQQAEELFELILKFAGYGFNKSHSTGYAIVAYHTAYLKTYFPNQYMAAFLTYESQANKVSEWIPYLEDCRRTRFVNAETGAQVKTGVEVRPPDINLSLADFSVVFDEKEEHDSHHGHVRFGLKAIKGAGDKAIEAIIRERERGGAYSSLFDFCERVPPGSVNKATIESLVKCGAFDGVHTRANRAAMVGTIEQALSAGAKLAADRAMGQGGLFLGPASGAPSARPAGPAPLARVEPWNETETLRQEKETLGFYVSSHPLERWRCWGQTFATTTTGGAKELPQDARVVMAVMVQSVRTILVKNGRSAGQKMGILTVEDLSGACEAVLFADAFARYGHLAVAEQVVFVLGRLDHSRGDPQVIVDRLVPIDGVPLDSGRLRLFVDEVRLNGAAPGAVTRVAELLSAPGAQAPAPATTAKAREEAPTLFGVEVVIGTERQVAVLAADSRVRVALRPELVGDLEAALGPGMVKVTGAIVDKPENNPRGKWQRRRGDDDE